jgi:hypothetical protein
MTRGSASCTHPSHSNLHAATSKAASRFQPRFAFTTNIYSATPRLRSNDLVFFFTPEDCDQHGITRDKFIEDRLVDEGWYILVKCRHVLYQYLDFMLYEQVTSLCLTALMGDANRQAL